jgi:hypothetical protein
VALAQRRSQIDLYAPRALALDAKLDRIEQILVAKRPAEEFDRPFL